VPGRAFILGGTGQIGRAVAGALAREGWAVVAGSRGALGVPAELAELGVEHRVVDRERPGALEAAVGGVDALVDIVSFTAADARQLVELGDRVGSVIAISSASVYADPQGRTLDESQDEDSFPRFPVPIPETYSTAHAGDETYSTSKVAMERVLLDEASVPVTVVRPCAIHGPGARHAREWYFQKRALDGRPYVVLSYGGESRFHTTSVANLAELIRLACLTPGTRVLNCGDPSPPSVSEIAALVAGASGHGFTQVLVNGPAPNPGVGETPWSVPRPMVVAMDAAERELGYRPVTTYAESVGETCAWLREAVGDRDWREVLPGLAVYPWELFDYEAEDRWLRELTGG
jgi:nucleoside-diphosphate-sugar epimerase